MHKVATLLNAIEAACTGLATTGTNVEQSRGYPKSETPAITIRLASIDPIRQLSNAFLDSTAEFETLYHVSGSDLDLDGQLLQIDAEVYAAMMADRTFGGAALATDPALLSVEASADGEVPTALAIRRWRCHVRHSITDAQG